MAEVGTLKPVNASQLSYELNAAPLRVIGPYPDGTTVVRSDELDDDDLRAGVDAHQADPEWTNPDAPPEPKVVPLGEVLLEVLHERGVLTDADVERVTGQRPSTPAPAPATPPARGRP